MAEINDNKIASSCQPSRCRWSDRVSPLTNQSPPALDTDTKETLQAKDFISCVKPLTVRISIVPYNQQVLDIVVVERVGHL